MRHSQIGQNFIQYPLLRARELKRQAREQLTHQLAFPAYCGRAFRLYSLTQTLEAQVMRQQFFEGEAHDRRMFSLRQQLHRRVRRRLMHQCQRLSQRR